MPVVSLVVFTPGRTIGAAFESSADVEILARVEDLERLTEVAAEQRPDALLVSLELDAQAVFEALEKLLVPRPLLFFYGPDDSHLILQAMRAGASEYIAPARDEADQMLAAIARLARETPGSVTEGPAPLIAVVGAKGGVGASFVACQLAASLTRLGRQTALVDGHLRNGDVALYLDLTPQYSFASLAMRNEPVDATYLRAAIAEHASGLRVLTAPKQPHEANAVDVNCVDSVAQLLRSEFDWVVWDTPSDLDERSLFILDRADCILLVTTPDVPALNRTRVQIELLDNLGRGEDSVRIVVNRTEARASVSLREAKEFLDRRIDAHLPNDYQRASVCVNEGRTIDELAPRSPLGRAVSELTALAHSWCDRTLPTVPKSGFLGRLRGK